MKINQFAQGPVVAFVLALALTACGGSADTTGSASSSEVSATTKVASPDTAARSTPGTTPATNDSQAPIGQRVQSKDAMRGVSPFKDRTTLGQHPTPHQIGLGVLAKEHAPMEKAAQSSHAGVPAKIGTGRTIVETANVQDTQAVLAWTLTRDGGHAAALRFSSSGAQGLRLGVLVDSLPMGSLLRFSADDSSKVFEVTALQIFQTIQRNIDAGDKTDAARIYWSPNLGGEAVTLEVVLPAGAPTEGVQIAVPKLSHRTANLSRPGAEQRSAGEAQQRAAGACNRDVACSSEYQPMSPSVALMDFVKSDGSGYYCTGTLMNDRSSDGIPYFLTAAHCIDVQSEASSLYTYWNVRKRTCAGSEYFEGNGLDDLLFGGATLLKAHQATDSTLLRLNENPPPGAVFAASIPSKLKYLDLVGSVHHPEGDVQKYNVGWLDDTYRLNFTSTGFYRSTASDANYYGVTWSTGVSEPGSSGSPLFIKLNGTQYVAGQLWGGYSSCSTPFGQDYFGRFDKSFEAGMNAWLGAYSTELKMPIHRFYNTKTRSHFFTMDQGERDNVIARFKEWSYEGISFYAYGAQHEGTLPVHRFYSTQTGSHFFTMSDVERDHIIANFPSWHYEGVAWYASNASNTQSIPLYRFYNVKGGTHFFTTSSAERDNIIANLPEWSYEGIGYQVWNTR